ncbi:Peptidase inhibitor family I36 [Streptosporangium subroseum]|uniref:Peptidase inhibitor family I36 n=1 Tax=Streptosporangium subroseum TaxID=106412 RepID=A0A239PE69_9ACTN|nr:peptidase inhibitor family I36 protein [Streptosporangium subroseum]SNT64699.1 Peptidase inhibitor family I36 [Streptosporangium subroseum]
MRLRSQLTVFGLMAVAAMSPLAGTAAASAPDPQKDAQPAVMAPSKATQLDAPAAAAGPRWVENPALPREFAINPNASLSSVSVAAVCPSGSYCAYYSPNRAGTGIGWSGDETQWSFLMNDQDESSWNNGTTGRGVTLYRNPSYVTALGCLPRGQFWSLHNPKDTGSSHRWAGC